MLLCLLLSPWQRSLGSSTPHTDYPLAGKLLSTRFSQGIYQGHAQNWRGLQGARGDIFIANGNGILEWNGEYWSKYPTPDGTRVRAMTQWKDGHLYLGTTNDVGRLEADESGQLRFRSLISDWPEEKRLFGEIWSVASDDRLVLFSSRKKLFAWDGSRLTVVKGFQPGPNRILHFQDRLLLFLPGKGLFRIDTRDGPKVVPLPFPRGLPEKSIVRALLPDGDGGTLIVTGRKGVFRWRDGRAEPVLDASRFGKGVLVYTALRGSDGYLYLGSLAHGLFLLSPDGELLRNFRRMDGLGTNTIINLFEDDQGNIWFTGDGSIGHFRPPHQLSRYHDQANVTGAFALRIFRGQPVVAGLGLSHLVQPAGSLAPPVLKPMAGWSLQAWDIVDVDHGLTLIAGEKGVHAARVDDDWAVTDARRVLKAMFAYGILPDRQQQGRYWVTTSDGLFHLQQQGESWEFGPVPGVEDEVQEMVQAPDGSLWVGTSHQRLYHLENTSGQGTVTVSVFGKGQGLPPGNVYPYLIDGRVLIGTTDGLMEPVRQPGGITGFQSARGMPKVLTSAGQDVFKLYQDSGGDLWFRAGMKAGRAHRDARGNWQVATDFLKPLPATGVVGLWPGKDGLLRVLYANGEFYAVDPGWLKFKTGSGRLAVRKIVDADTGELLAADGGELSGISLAHQDNGLRIYYSLSEYSLPEQTLYSTRLLKDGEGNWSSWNREYWRDYRNLPGGDYRFQLRARDPWGKLFTAEAMPVHVALPWYLGVWARLLYVLVFLLLLGMAAYLGRRWRVGYLEQQKAALEQEVAHRTRRIEAQAAELREQQQLKDRFFANVSHEFRTPLTLIIEPLRELRHSVGQELPPEASGLLDTALKSSRQMLDLIGQVLDVKRLESGQFALRVAEHDLADLLRQVENRFRPWVRQQSQTLSLVGCEDPVLLYFDWDQIDRAVSNLVSNAVKYSGLGSHIRLELQAGDDEICVLVVDDGPGIPEALRDKVFERYVQGEQADGKAQPGTGIGLSLARDLVDMHQGRLVLDSTETGKGACFRLCLKRGKAHYSATEMLPEPGDSPVSDSSSSRIFKEEARQRTLLVVDDNADLRRFIVERLSSGFQILEAGDGATGLDLARERLPDLIITDVAMPRMDGLTLLSRLRNEAATRDIPVILLTARTTKRDTVRGLQAGADDYLTKPFDTSELVVRINGLLEKQDRLRQLLLEQYQTREAPESQQSFGERLRVVLGRYLSDPELDMTRLAGELAVSRATLYRRIQKETGMSAAQFVRTERLKLARKLLQEGQGKVGEVAYACGFENLSGFSRSYKEYWGVPPSRDLAGAVGAEKDSNATSGQAD
ncbi:two component AraC family transcriptional regulator [Thiolapillus brandeum]|uniref:histidine kinase n=2 Tax=Thiolapillus brandeum TaxID=1076588 RepID=A0A7U6JI11_9GAMM|nr:two component AraC family transcriptional regulator [Thiolapillus brandeum]